MAATSTVIGKNLNIKIGPWGGQGQGNSIFDFGQNSSRIVQIELYSATVVDSLKLYYMVDGEEIKTSRAGGSGGALNPIQLDPEEYIHSIVGSFGTYKDQTCITQLEFKTNLGKKHGPFGKGGGEEFTLPTDGRLVGFFGEFGDYINAIGFYMTP